MTSFFQMVNETKYGCSILVSSVAKPTVAKLSLEDPSEVFCRSVITKGYIFLMKRSRMALSLTICALTVQVMEFLRRLVHWKQWGFESRNNGCSTGVPSIP